MSVFLLGFPSNPVIAFVPLIFILIFGFLFYRILTWLLEWHSNNNAEVIETRAKIVDKRQYSSVSGGFNDQPTSTSYTHFVTFEFPNQERLELKVKHKEFGLLVVGDEGVLNYQGTRFNSFSRQKPMNHQFY